MDKTVKQILEDALKRAFEDHNIRIEEVRVQWITRSDGDAHPVSFEIDGQVV